MKISRLFEIVYILINKKMTTADELAAHFEVSKRTIYRDIDSLANAGIPVYSLQGRNGGICIMDNFLLDKTSLSDEEQKEILLSLQSLSSTKIFDNQDIINKLSVFFNKDDDNLIEIDFSSWESSIEEKEKFEILKNSIINSQKLKIDYRNPYESSRYSRRSINPLKLVYKQDSWYLQAFCSLRDDYRLFKIKRIFNLNVLDENFDPSDFKCPKITEGFNENLAEDIILKFDNKFTNILLEDFSEKSIIKFDDKYILLKTKMKIDYWIKSFILSFGPNVEVISPLSLQNEIKNLISQSMQKYVKEDLISNICQSCSTPFKVKFSNSQSLANYYCEDCFIDGNFLENISKNEMIERALNDILQSSPNSKKNDVKKELEILFTKLKRWR